jgi:hypothetical protein
LSKSDKPTTKQENETMTDHSSNVTVLHDRRKEDRPPAIEFAEHRVEQVTGYAATDDGHDCVLRTITDDGRELRIVIPTTQVEALVGAARAAKMTAAAAKMNVTETGASAVFMPKRYETIRIDNFEGVLLAFDRGTESEQIIGIDNDAAIRLGQDLRKSGKAGHRLLLPNKDF